MTTPSRATMVPTAALVVATLALYLYLVYTFSYSRVAASSRQAINLAIVMLDVVLVAGWLALRRRRAARPDDHVVRRWLRLAGDACLMLVVLLHAGYVGARWWIATAAASGTLDTIKACIVPAQALALFFGALARPGLRTAAFGPKRSEMMLFTLALVPLLNYLTRNRESFSVPSAAQYLVFFVACPVVLFLIVRLLQRASGARPIAAPLVAGLAFVHYSLPQVTALLEKPVEAIFPVQAALALTIPGILAAAYLVDSRLTAAAVVAFSVCSAAWSAIAVRGDLERGAPMSSSPPQDAASGLSPLEEVLSRPAQRRPDVYLLVYDGLAPSAMMRHYGIDDEPTDSYLTDRGFKEYVGAHSLFLSSVGSMGSVMDMRYVPRTGIGGNNTAIRFFKDHGYTVRLVLNTWLLQNSLPFAADDVFPRRHYRSDLPFLYRGLGAGEFKSEIVFEDSAPAEWVEAKRAALGRKTGPPTMLYAHSRFPGHSQNSGRCLPDEVAQYATRLATADEEMRGDIETILGNGREAIIIVAGDHGPYLTGDCLLMSGSAPEDLSAIHLYDRYGAKLLIRWPAPVPPALDRIEVLQDLIFGVAAYLLDDEEVWRYRLPRETVGTGNIPFRAIKNGIVAIGPDRGKPLYWK